jgi:hypothetical protein
MTYGTHSVLREPMRVGSAIGNAPLRVTIGTDGGMVQVTANDKNGNAIGDALVLVLPGQIASEAELAAAMISGQTDQNGAWTSSALAPGKYFVLATGDVVNKSPEDIGKLWRARGRGQQVEVGPNATAAVTVTPAALD